MVGMKLYFVINCNFFCFALIVCSGYDCEPIKVFKTTNRLGSEIFLKFLCQKSEIFESSYNQNLEPFLIHSPPLLHNV